MTNLDANAILSKKEIEARNNEIKLENDVE
jgi:hypothetical protein